MGRGEGAAERAAMGEAELERATLARVDEVGGCKVRSLMRGESCLLGGGGGGRRKVPEGGASAEER